MEAARAQGAHDSAHASDRSGDAHHDHDHDHEQGQGHGHGHGHGHAHGHTGAPLVAALVVTLAIALLEAAGGIAAHSLALLSDSAHVFMDAVALGIAVFAAIQARRPANEHRSFGYARVEILAGLGNAVLLFGITVAVAIAAVGRLGLSLNPGEAGVAASLAPLPSGPLMATVAAIGALANVFLGLALARRTSGDLNAKAALMHVMTDVLGAAVVALGGVAVALTHRAWIDPVLSLLVCALIVAGVVRIVREAGDVLLESVPAHLTVPQVKGRIRALPGVLDVHDLHVWSIGSGTHVLSAHVLLADSRISDASQILRTIDRTMRDEFAISHVTVQFECESCGAAASAGDPSDPSVPTIVCTQPR